MIIALIAVAGLGYWLFMMPPASTDSNVNVGANSTATTTDTNANVGTATGSSTSTSSTVAGSVDVSVGTGKTVTVNYDGSKFTPSTVTIAKGDTVTFVAASGKTFWVAADEHPTHTEYDGTSRSTHCAAGYAGAKPFDQCASGSTYSFTFTKSGTFDYHDHMHAQAEGKVVVQ